MDGSELRESVKRRIENDWEGRSRSDVCQR